ncbi:MAG: LysM peptidoglycan-binding domain-containing protein [Anaerolineales bacterium]|nr:LysM peptidoglycan-binding domain-containing protein [Anaerolineales bacterium]
MKSYRLFVFFIILSLAAGITACERNLPAPKKTAEPESLPATPTEYLDVIQLFATQTAQAMPGQITEVPASEPTIEPALNFTPAATEAPPMPTQAPEELPVIVVPTATPGLPATYTLQKGEFPFCIARRFNVDPGELLRLNGISGNLYSAGMVLKIPQTGRAFPGSRALRSHPTTYTVGSGETIFSIACLFGDVDPNAIAFANNLTPPYKLTAGQTIQIP